MANVWLLTERQKTVDLYLRCAANFYGHITPRAFLMLFNRYNEKKLLKAELLKYYNKLMRQDDRNYIIYTNAIMNAEVNRGIVEEVMYYQADKKFYIPPKDEFLRYVSPHYYEKSIYTESIRSFLTKEQGVNVFAADSVILKLVWLIRTERRTSDMAEMLTDCGIIFKNIDIAQRFWKMLQDLNNNTRKWANCGYTPKEMHREC